MISDNTTYNWEQIICVCAGLTIDEPTINAIRQSLTIDGPWSWLQVNQALMDSGFTEPRIYQFLQYLNPTKVENVKFTNQFNVAVEQPKWKKTPDGFLRCKARVLAERVMPYHVSELSELPENIHGDVVNMHVPISAMQDPEALSSLEGAQITIGDHHWLTPDTVQEFSRGSVAGTPTLDGPYLVCDLLVTHPDAIEQIESGQCPEISAAYLADTIFEPGTYGDSPYDAQQVNLRFNHIAVIPAGHGRAGQDVRILNKQKGEQVMADEKTLVRVRLVNTGKMLNTDEEGAAAMEEESKASSANLEKTMSELEAKNGEMKALQAEVEDLKGQLSVYKEKLDQLLSTEAIEGAAAEMVAEAGEADEIIENMVDDEAKEEIKNSIKGKFGNSLRSLVLAGIGVKTEGMSEAAIHGAFKAQAQIANTMKGKGNGVKVAGEKLMNKKGDDQDAGRQQYSNRKRLGLPEKGEK